MAIGNRRNKPQQTAPINHGRPPLVKSHKPALSSKATRELIRSHHTLQKERAKAVSIGDESHAQTIESQIHAKGGLASYQIASKLGQSRERGGDSSKVLVDWLKPELTKTSRATDHVRMLEIGALSTRNACSNVKGLQIRRIDLHSQEPGIEEVDFMDLPLPKDHSDAFDIISLSLVLNYVPDATARGEMLKRISTFLRPAERPDAGIGIQSLFIVLPLPCVSNSRYLTEKKLEEILGCLGFSLQRAKSTSKLFYSLWKLDGRPSRTSTTHNKKQELRSGSSRNNFAIVLK